LQEE
jgi:hypothetical protein